MCAMPTPKASIQSHLADLKAILLKATIQISIKATYK
jgi:hypothetical protein